MNTARIPPLNERLCRGAGWLALVRAAAFLLGNAGLWFAPDPSNDAVRMAAHYFMGLITVMAAVRAMGFGLTTLILVTGSVMVDAARIAADDREIV